MMGLASFNVYLFEKLRDPEFAAIYLQDALEDSPEEFLVALRKYVQANGGMTRCAEQTQLARESLYRMLSEQGNPEWRSINAILKAHGLRLSIQSEKAAA
jgi:probable addiction module antidote protein